MIKNHTASAAKFFSFAILFTLASFIANAQVPTDPAAISAGKALFEGNCKACHRVKQKLVGPALAGVYDRAPSLDWIKAFVKNSSKVIASGDPYAQKIYEENNKTQMTAFSSFKDEQILSIMAYVKSEADKADAPAATAAPAPGSGTDASQGVPSTYLNVILIGMIIILALLLVILGFLVSALKRFLDQKNLSEEEKEQVESRITIGSVTRSSGFIFIVVFLVGALGFKAVINGLFSIGVLPSKCIKSAIPPIVLPLFSH